MEYWKNLESKFSIRLYEYLYSVYCKRLSGINNNINGYAKSELEVNISLDELKYWLILDKCKTYDNFGKFREKVLDIAVREINKYTNIFVSYSCKKTGRKVTGLSFFIQIKIKYNISFTYQRG